MGLGSNLAPFVDSLVRRRGAEYFRSRRVRLDVCTSTEAEAIVTGSSRYLVRLRRAGRTLRGTCSCPYVERGEACKHIWATVLAADVKGGLRAPDGSPPLRFDLDSPGSEPEEAERDDWRQPRPAPPPPRTRAAAPSPSRTPTWRELISQISPAGVPAPSWAPAGELVYVVDVPASQKAQTLTLQVLVAPRKRDGSRGAPRPLKLNRSDIPHLPDADDRKILFLLAGAAQGGLNAPWQAPYANTPVPAVCEVLGTAASLVLPQLCATGRFHLQLAPDSVGETPLAWDEGPPWELGLELREEKGGVCLLTGWLRRSGERLPLTQPALLLRDGYLFTHDRVARFEGGGAFSWVALLRRHGDLRVPAAERDELLERLLAAPDLPRLDLPPSMRYEEVHPTPQPRLRLRAPDKRAVSKVWTRAELSFLYEGREVPAHAAGHGIFLRRGRRFLHRDSATEERSAARLRQLGFRFSSDVDSGEPEILIAHSRIPKAVRALLTDGWSVEAEGKLYRSAGRFQVGVSSGIDWFELHARADFAGQSVELPALLAALRRGESFVALGDGSLGILPEEWLKRLAPVAGLGAVEGDHVQFPSSQVALLDAFLDQEPTATFDAVFDRARKKLREFSGVEPVHEPKGFRGELRGYQRVGLGWLHYLREFHFGGCLADDMGLGKTVQVLALLEERRTRRAKEGLPPSLLVVPKSLVFNWLAEAARFTPRLTVLDHTGSARAKEGEAFTGHDLVLTTYGTLRRDIARLRETEFDYLILDEAQAIKNAGSQTARSARLLRGRHRLALTGTPIENHLGELWSLLEFLNPGLGGTSTLFSGHGDDLRDADPETRELLARAVRPFLLRRTKEAVAPELPEKVEQTLFCELPPHQRQLYDDLRDHYRTALDARIGKQGLGRSKLLVLEALLRLRQAACHPGLVDPNRAQEPCAKLELLLPQLQEILEEGHKALVFSQFTSFLALLRRELDAQGTPYLYLDGKTRDRQERVERFQSDPEAKLFLISLKAGGLGLNLTAADYVYLLDPWWNPAVESQAIDRTHRIGQTRPVFACRLVARGTVEEKILELQKHKRALADAVIEADQSLVAGLTREDLELLLS